jgi:antitoxin component YwqK of YwqJK toxin-antitoxin module
MLRSILYILTLLIVLPTFSQSHISEKKYSPDAVIDAKYGIIMYKNLNMMLGEDTVRNVNGYAANGFVKDFYITGELLHKGFYVEGQLKVYRNYFPNEIVERNFRLIDTKKSKMDIYYKDGTLKSKITYINSEAQSWEDYYPNGTLEFIEVYDKDIQYYVEKANYYEDGSPENTLVLENKKKLVYTQTYFYPNGKVKKVGQMKFLKMEFDYQNIGTWIEYDNTGKAIKEIKYASGAIQSETDL